MFNIFSAINTEINIPPASSILFPIELENTVREIMNVI